MSRRTGKVAVITGGGNGLGEAIATRMAEEDAAVAILDRDERGREDALAYAPENIRVNSIDPGFIFTDMIHHYATEAGLSEADARGALDPAHPLGGAGEPDDIAWGAVYLASDQAKRVTGSELVIDGGYTAR